MACRVLQCLITDGDTIMLTTSHKARFSIEEWKAIFRNGGLIIHNIQSLPENTAHLSRRDETVHWFALNQVGEDFLIIDDDRSLNELPDFLKERLMQTSSYIGLADAVKAVVKQYVEAV